MVQEEAEGRLGTPGSGGVGQGGETQEIDKCKAERG